MADEKQTDAKAPAAAEATTEAPASEVDTSSTLQTVKEATAEERKAKDEERAAAKESADPVDDLAAAQPDVGTAISVPDVIVEAEEPAEPTVKVKVRDSFTVPVLEEYRDEQDRPRGRIKGYEAPTDVRIAVAQYDPETDKEVDEDGYIAISGTVELPQHLADQVLGSVAVEVAE